MLILLVACIFLGDIANSSHHSMKNKDFYNKGMEQ